MRLECDEGVSDSVWDDLVRSCGGSVFHSCAWSVYIHRARAHTTPVRFRLIDENGKVVGAALGFRTRSANPLLKQLTGHLWFDSLPAVSPIPHALSAFVEQIESHAIKAGETELSFGSYGCRADGGVLRTRQYSLSERIEFELDLGLSVEDLWMSLKHKRRKNVNKSRRAGVVIEEMAAQEGLAELARLMDVTWQRLEQRGVKRAAGGRKADSTCPEQSLLDSGVARLVGARLGSDWLSASLFTQFAGQVYHVLSGHSAQAMATQAPTLLLWESICSFKAEGARRFNFGGCPAVASNPDSPEHGVFDYKRAFGGERVECSSGRIVLRPARLALVRTLRSLTGR